MVFVYIIIGITVGIVACLFLDVDSFAKKIFDKEKEIEEKAKKEKEK